MYETEKQKDLSLLTMASIIVILVAIVAVCANAQKALRLDKELEKPSKLISTPTNLDAVLAGSGELDSVCVGIWKGRHIDGKPHEGTELKISQQRFVHSFSEVRFEYPDGKKLYWNNVCQDASLEIWNIYQPQIQVWPKGKIEAFQRDTLNRYMVEEADLTTLQKQKLREGKNNIQALGNYRLRKEPK